MQQIHINKLPTIKYFSISELKQMLPIHQQTAIQNLKIVMNNYALSKYPKNTILLPDQNLSIERQDDQNLIAYYSYLKAIWCQDFEEQSELIKNSLNFASSLLNYLGVIDQDTPYEQNQNEDYGFVNKMEILSIIGGVKIQNKLKKYQKIQQKKTIIGFKFEKVRNRIYFLMGVNIKTRSSLALACSILRQWNFTRLKLNTHSSGLDIDLIHRVIQHLFCLGRGFVRQVPDDYNTYHANLQKYINLKQGFYINENKLCERFDQLKLNSSNLQHQAMVMVCNISFKRDFNKASLWQIVSQVVVQWLLQTPYNASCSYASDIYQPQNVDSITLVVSSHYQSSNKNKLPNSQTLLASTSQIQFLLFDQIYKKPHPLQNPMKKSFQMLNKYQNQPNSSPIQKTEKVQKQDLTLMRQLTPSQKSLNQSMLSHRQTQSRKSNIKNIVKLQNELYQILKVLDMNKRILNPTQIGQLIRSYITKEKKKLVITEGLSEKQYEVFEVFRSIDNKINSQQLYTLIKNNANQINIISQYFIHNNKYARTVQTGKKIAYDNLDVLYKNSIKNGLINNKNTILPCYLKKMVLIYIQPLIPASPLKIQQISIPQLIQLIQTKNYNSKYYTSILTILFPQLFINYTPIIKLLSPLLSYFIEHLISNDHHQQLIYSFIGDLLYQICYFLTDNKINLLTNSVYMGQSYNSSLSLKQKKVLEMLRQGGFKGFGYEIKTHILPIIQSNKNYTKPKTLLYQMYKIQRPNQFLHFYKILSLCHYRSNINEIAKYLEKKNCYAEILENCGPLVCYFVNSQFEQKQKKLIDFKKTEIRSIEIVQQKEQEVVNQAQFSSIAQRILRSQSGIFSDMVRLNPNIKIAGIELKTAMKNMSKSTILQKPKQQKKFGILNQQYVIKTYLPQSRHQQYQYIQLALSLKQKYMNYQMLSQLEKQYFKECANYVVQNAEQIRRYVSLSEKAKLVENQLKKK